MLELYEHIVVDYASLVVEQIDGSALHRCFFHVELTFSPRPSSFRASHNLLSVNRPRLAKLFDKRSISKVWCSIRSAMESTCARRLPFSACASRRSEVH